MCSFERWSLVPVYYEFRRIGSGHIKWNSQLWAQFQFFNELIVIIAILHGELNVNYFVLV